MKLLLLALFCLAAGCATPPPSSGSTEIARTQYFELSWDSYWLIDTPKRSRFDASGLLVNRTGELFTVNDRGPELFKIQINGTNASLSPSGIFPEKLLRQIPSGDPNLRFDTEGLARGDDGTIYICEESRRTVYSWSLQGQPAELKLDFGSSTQYFSRNLNASFEGIAVSPHRLYLANEREMPRIIVLDLKTGAWIEDFLIQPAGFALGGSQYSDLDYVDGHLFVLDRNYRCILEVDPATQRTIAQYNFGKMEQLPEVDYKTDYPTGTMEGLAVTRDHFYLITDNNGLGRKSAPKDFRPTLFKVPRPRLAR